MCIYDLNKTLKNIVKVLRIGYKASNRQLNLNVRLCICKYPTTDTDKLLVKENEEQWHRLRKILNSKML